jgi:peptidoglycan/LPS O-acetylase OafA/YrhL
MWVVMAHGSVWWRPGLVRGAAGDFFSYGQLAVYIFFVLSGVILGYTYVGPAGTLRGGTRGFWVARFARIYPMYALGLLLGLLPYFWWHGDLPATVCGTGGTLPQVLGTFLLAQEWVMSGICLDPPAWSLSVEAAFYLTFPLWVLLAGRLSRSMLLGTLIALWLLFAAVMQDPAHVTTSYFYFPVFLSGLVLGCLIIRAPLTSRAVGYVGPVVALAAILWIGAHPDRTLQQQAALLLPCFALLIWSLTPTLGVGQILGLSPLVLLGEASYGLYIVHWPLLEWFTHATGRSFGTPAGADRLSVPLFAVYVLCALAFSLLCFRYVETPARRWLRLRMSPARAMNAEAHAILEPSGALRTSRSAPTD